MIAEFWDPSSEWPEEDYLRCRLANTLIVSIQKVDVSRN
jgi:hypothetical protein